MPRAYAVSWLEPRCKLVGMRGSAATPSAAPRSSGRSVAFRPVAESKTPTAIAGRNRPRAAMSAVPLILPMADRSEPNERRKMSSPPCPVSGVSSARLTTQVAGTYSGAPIKASRRERGLPSIPENARPPKAAMARKTALRRLASLGSPYPQSASRASSPWSAIATPNPERKRPMYIAGVAA